MGIFVERTSIGKVVYVCCLKKDEKKSEYNESSLRGGASSCVIKCNSPGYILLENSIAHSFFLLFFFFCIYIPIQLLIRFFSSFISTKMCVCVHVHLGHMYEIFVGYNENGASTNLQEKLEPIAIRAIFIRIYTHPNPFVAPSMISSWPTQRSLRCTLSWL